MKAPQIEPSVEECLRRIASHAHYLSGLADQASTGFLPGPHGTIEFAADAAGYALADMVGQVAAGITEQITILQELEASVLNTKVRARRTGGAR